MRIDALPLRELSEGDRARWRAAHTASEGAVRGPFFSLGYAEIVDAHRNDVRVALIQGAYNTAGFFAAHRPSPFAGIPLGAPLSNYHGLVGPLDLDVPLAGLCAALGVGRLDFTHAAGDMPAFARHALGEHPSWYVSLAEEPYRAGLRARRSKLVYELERKERKLARAHGTVRLEISADRGTLDIALAWKRAQLERTVGDAAHWRTPWIVRTMQDALASDAEDFGALLFALYAGEKLVAVNVCFRSADVLHGLLMAHDPAYDEFSPGVALIVRLIEWAQANGYKEVDFGGGRQAFKRQLATSQRPMIWGWAGRPSFASASRRVQYALRRRIERAPQPWIASLPGRAMRRIDVMRGLGAPPPSLLASPATAPEVAPRLEQA